jgi:hypothetical protein
MLDPQVIEIAQRLTGEVAKLRMVPLGLELGNDNDGQYDTVLGEPADCRRICQQNAGVEDVGAARLAAANELRGPPGSCWMG